MILGGINIPWNKGLLGHSDGDVLSHAIGDALLGASGKRDIGTYFPDTDAKYKGISSLVLLEKIKKIANVEILNVDSVIVCEAPKLAPFISLMQEKIAQILGVKSISIKAKTNEGVGSVGKGEGIGAYSVALVLRK